MSCWGGETDPKFSHDFVLAFTFGSLTLASDPRVVESIIVLVPVEQPLKERKMVYFCFLARNLMKILKFSVIS